MKISKTTLNYANKRKVLIAHDGGEAFLTIKPFPLDQPPAVVYRQTEDQEGFVFRYNVWLTQETKGELPHWIQNEKQLREVVDFLSKCPEFQEGYEY